MTLLRSVALATLLLAACGGGSKSSTMPDPAPTAPAADEAAPSAEATPAEPAMAPTGAVPAAPAEEAAPVAAPAPAPAARKTRAPVKKSADPCDGGE